MFTFRNGDDLELFPASGECEMFQQSDDQGFIIGGSEKVGQQTAITVLDRFRRGFSGTS